jgi:hypothetical protein
MLWLTIDVHQTVMGTQLVEIATGIQLGAAMTDMGIRHVVKLGFE